MQKPQPTNEIERCAAAIEQRRQDLEKKTGERKRRKGATQATTTAQARAHAALAGIISNPMRYATASEGELSAAKQALVSAAKAATQAAAELAAHESEHGDLQAIAEELGRDHNLLEQARDQANHKAITERKLKAALDLESAELEEHDLLQRAYARWPEDNGAILKGAALPILTFPGTFVPSAATAGHTAKSVFADDFLPMVGRCYPDLLDLLPADRAAVVRDKIQADETRGVFTFAGKSPWHIGEMHGARGPQLARGAIRRGIRDL